MSKQSELDAMLTEYRRRVFKEQKNKWLPAIISDENKKVLNWHNKQIEAVLDRLQESTNDGIFLDLERAIEAERKRINKTEKQ